MDGRERQECESTDGLPVSRRTFLISGAGVVGTVLGSAVVGSAQVTTDAALPASAPTMDRDDYTGLLVQVVDTVPDADTGGLDACEFLEADDTPTAYDIRLLDRIQEDHQSEGSTLFAAADNENIDNGKLFIINTQQQCSDEYVSVTLEQIGASAVGTPSHPAAGEQVSPGEVGEVTTESEGPGYGVGTAVGALGASALLAFRRLRRR